LTGGGSGTEAVNDSTAGDALPEGNVDLMVARVNADAALADDRLLWWLNGSQLGFENDKTTAPSTADAHEAMVIGAGRSSDYAVDLDGSIAEILIYEADLSTTDREALEVYLAQKWGVTLS
jgi:hypothetical protein